ncbi:MAG: DUF4421 family protein [Salinivirgaceae bacterium]|nr:DUF4421 family protein [Salinivirgaceae bacterium]
MRTRLAILFFLLAAAQTSVAQGFAEFIYRAFNAERDTLYVDDLSRMFSVNASLFQKNSAFSIDDLKNLSSLQYSCSDSSSSVSAGFAYKWLSLNLGFSTGLFDRHRTGSKTVLSTQILLPAVTLKFSGSVYEGYYLENAETILQNWPEGTRHDRPDITTASLRVSADYYFNYTKYSRKALTSHGELQRRTAGSAIAGILFNINMASGDSSLVPRIVNDSLFGYHEQLKFVSNTLIGAGGGYARTFVTPAKIYFNLDMQMGLAYNKCLLQLDDAPDRRHDALNFYFQGDLSFGYNSNHWFFNVGGNVLAIESPMGNDGVNINNMNAMLRATLAYRFELEKNYGVGELFTTKWRQWREHRAEKKAGNG